MNLLALKSVGSTNDHAKELARTGAVAGTVVWAEEQTAGRGRQGNQWVSKPGNLFMSMIVRPDAVHRQLGQLSFVTAVALAEVVEGLAKDADVRLKWPNDLLVDGKKAAGILIETEGSADWAVIGIGVNVADAPADAASLADAGVDARHVLGLVVDATERCLKQWEDEGFAPIRAAWMKRAFRHGEEITARLPQETLTGVFDGIDDTGALLLTLPTGALRTINSGEVFL